MSSIYFPKHGVKRFIHPETFLTTFVVEGMCCSLRELGGGPFLDPTRRLNADASLHRDGSSMQRLHLSFLSMRGIFLYNKDFQ